MKGSWGVLLTWALGYVENQNIFLVNAGFMNFERPKVNMNEQWKKNYWLLLIMSSLKINKDN